MNVDTLRALPAVFLLAVASGCRESTPVQPPPPSRPALKYASVQAALDRTCALTQDGHTYCWGHAIPDATADSTLTSLVPSPVAPALVLRSLSLGDAHQCGLTAGGQAYCWGANNHFQFGDGLGADSLRPTPVAGTLTFTALTAGGQHTCGLAGGVAFCWGWDAFGQLGFGLTVDFGLPEAVVGRRSFTAISAGENHTCALTPTGAAYCWGLNDFGQLGGDSLRQQCGGAPCSQVPIPVAGGPAFASITVGGSHTCALTSAGLAYCWGRGDLGELGGGTATTSAVPVPVTGGLRFQSLSAGLEHTCGVTADGTAYCWGHNNFGRLGTGGPEGIVPQPTPVSGSHRFLQVSAGTLHTCGITTDAAAYCWGFGGLGQLGNDLPLSQPTPVLVAEPADSSRS